MNALQAVKQMEKELRNAGFEITVNETEREYRVEAVVTGAWYESTTMFFASAWKSPSNRWVKFLSVVRIDALNNGVTRKNKLSYQKMWSEINFVTRFYAKVGA